MTFKNDMGAYYVDFLSIVKGYVWHDYMQDSNSQYNNLGVYAGEQMDMIAFSSVRRMMGVDIISQVKENILFSAIFFYSPASQIQMCLK